MLAVFNGNVMWFFCCFRIEKSKIRKETVPKAKKKRENEQVHFGQNSTLFACAKLSPNSATNALDLFVHPAYSLLLPFPLPLLESLLSPWASAGLASSSSSSCSNWLRSS
jgi:hypothetical protein